MSDDAWDQDAEHRLANFEHMMARWQQDHDERTIEAAETSLADITSLLVPMPNTAHPSLAPYADAVRSIANPLVRLPKVRMSGFADMSDEPYPTAILPETTNLTRKKCAALAPFVGDPRWQQGHYVWAVWVDDAGRHVAADAELVIHPAPPTCYPER